MEVPVLEDWLRRYIRNPGVIRPLVPQVVLRWVAREKAFINSTNGLVVVEVCVQLNHTPLLSEDIQVIL